MAQGHGRDDDRRRGPLVRLVRPRRSALPSLRARGRRLRRRSRGGLGPRRPPGCRRTRGPSLGRIHVRGPQARAAPGRRDPPPRLGDGANGLRHGVGDDGVVPSGRGAHATARPPRPRGSRAARRDADGGADARHARAGPRAPGLRGRAQPRARGRRRTPPRRRGDGSSARRAGVRPLPRGPFGSRRPPRRRRHEAPRGVRGVQRRRPRGEARRRRGRARGFREDALAMQPARARRRGRAAAARRAHRARAPRARPHRRSRGGRGRGETAPRRRGRPPLVGRRRAHPGRSHPPARGGDRAPERGPGRGRPRAPRPHRPGLGHGERRARVARARRRREDRAVPRPPR